MSKIGWLAVLMLASVNAAAADGGRDRRDILQVEAALCRAFEQGDAAALRRHLDPGFSLVDSRGTVTDLAANLDEVEKREPRYRVFRNQQQQIRMYGASAVVVGVTHIEGVAKGEEFSADFRFTDTWIRRPDGWKLAASHASLMPAQPASP